MRNETLLPYWWWLDNDLMETLCATHFPNHFHFTEQRRKSNCCPLSFANCECSRVFISLMCIIFQSVKLDICISPKNCVHIFLENVFNYDLLENFSLGLHFISVFSSFLCFFSSRCCENKWKSAQWLSTLRLMGASETSRTNFLVWNQKAQQLITNHAT